MFLVVVVAVVVVLRVVLLLILKKIINVFAELFIVWLLPLFIFLFSLSHIPLFWGQFDIYVSWPPWAMCQRILWMERKKKHINDFVQFRSVVPINVQIFIDVFI